ncbi:MAG: hypothetical protein AAF391_03005 [Bacteroidota bacterium]
MLIEFDKMPDDARLWIYQASRQLSDNEVSFVKKHTEQFLNQWQAHGNDLKASYRLEHNQFLVITVDESFSQASGCSIDSSVHLIEALQNELSVSFMTTSQVAFLLNEKIELFPFNKLKSQVQEQVITPETMIFDNTVKNVSEFREKWLVSSSQTWVNRYFG